MRKRQSFILFCLIVITFTWGSNLYALPEGEVVVSGAATFDRTTQDTLNINTPSNKLIVNYNSFSIAQPETVNFYQPSSSAIALNRIVGIDPSSIFGKLTANGRIFLINPNGIVFGPNSQVDVAGLVASTLNISNEDFLAGRYTFYGQDGSVVNQGYISSPGGYVALLGSTVENTGVIEADLGTVVLASGEAITLNLDPQGLISVVIDEATAQNLEQKEDAVKNAGEISTDGGKVILTAKVLNNVFDYAINNEGIIEADTLNNRAGVIELTSTGAINSTGTMSAEGGIIKICTDDKLTLGGSYKADEIIFDPEWVGLTAELDLYGDSTWWSTGDIDVTYDISTTGGFLKFYADATDKNNTRDTDGLGDFIQGINTTIDVTGDIEISGVKVEMGKDSVIKAGNNVDVSVDNKMEMAENAKVDAGNNATVTVTDELEMKEGARVLGGNNADVTAGKLEMAKNNRVEATVGNATVTVTDKLEMGKDSVIEAGDDVDVSADNMTMNASSKIIAGGDIVASAGNNMSLVYLQAGDTVNLTADSNSLGIGAITDNNGNSDNIIANNLILSAASGIGSGNALETKVDTLDATNTTSGNVEIDNTGNLSLESINTPYDVIIASTDDITIGTGTVTSTSGGVDISSEAGSIYADGSGPHIKAALTSYLSSPNGVIGTLSNSLNVSISDGGLVLNIGDTLDSKRGSAGIIGVSGNLSGAVSGAITFDPNSYTPPLYPPGYVFFNDIEIYPDFITQIMKLLSSRFTWPVSEQLQRFSINTMDLMTSVYFYHPIAAVDTEAFEGFQLTEEMYEYIEGAIRLREQELFPWFEEEIKKRRGNEGEI